jgi:hypothetical protein
VYDCPLDRIGTRQTSMIAKARIAITCEFMTARFIPLTSEICQLIICARDLSRGFALAGSPVAHTLKPLAERLLRFCRHEVSSKISGTYRLSFYASLPVAVFWLWKVFLGSNHTSCLGG